MRIAIVDDLAEERALLRQRLEHQLACRSVQAELLEFASGEEFLAAEKAAPFTAVFLDIYMDGHRLPADLYHHFHRSRTGGVSGPRDAVSRQAVCRGRRCAIIG